MDIEELENCFLLSLEDCQEIEQYPEFDRTSYSHRLIGRRIADKYQARIAQLEAENKELRSEVFNTERW